MFSTPHNGIIKKRRKAASLNKAMHRNCGRCRIFQLAIARHNPVIASVSWQRTITHTARERRFILVSCVVVFAAVFGVTIGVRNAYESWRVQQLIEQLGSSTEAGRDTALETLVDLHVDVIDDLIALMAHDDPDVREFAAFSLSHQVPIPGEVVPTFARVLLDEEEEDGTRRWIGDTFVRIAEQAQGAPTDSHRKVINALRQAIQSDNEAVAASAVYALDEFGPMASSVEPDLLKIWKESPTFEVAGALCSIRPGEHEEEVLTFLAAGLDPSDNDRMMSALYYIGRLGSAAGEVVPRLQALASNHPGWEYNINEAIRAIESPPK